MPILFYPVGPQTVGGTGANDLMLMEEDASAITTDNISGYGGNDVILGDHDAVLNDNSASNTTLGSAFSIDAVGRWSVAEDPLLADDTLPHTTVMGTGSGVADFFQISLGSGVTLTLDIDFGAGSYGGLGFNALLNLRRSDGMLLASNDTAATELGGLGSFSTDDPYLEFTNSGPLNIFYIEVVHSGGTGVPVGATYMLNVTATMHGSTGSFGYDRDNIFGDAGNDILFGYGQDDVIYGGDGDDTLYGGSSIDTLYGGNGADVLYGGLGADVVNGGNDDDVIILRDGEGADSIFGGIGTDQVDFTTLPAGVSLDLSMGTYSFGVLSGIESVLGTNFPDTLLGGTARNVLDGLDGNDLITGEGGNDDLFGGNGNDTLSGGSGSDLIYGGDGNDILDGGAEADILSGGLGNDRYIVAAPGDAITLEQPFSLGGGIDTVESWITWTLGSNLEVLRLQGTDNIDGFGNAAPESIVGNPGANTLGAGGGNDILNAKAGDDTLIGGTGRDTMVGDGGADVFVYNSFAESYAGAATRDFLNGFTHGQDVIDLSAIDANPFNAGDQAFTFIGNAAFTGAGSNSAGELRYFTFGGGAFNILEADWNGDGVAELQIFINSTNYMTGADFIL